MDTTRRGSSTLLTVGSVLGWVVMAVALWVLLLRGGQDVVADQFGVGEPMALVTIGVLTVLVLVGALGSLFCAERLSAGASPGALVTAGGGVLLVVVVAAGALVAQASVTAAVANAADVSGATPAAQVLAIVLTMVLGVAGVAAVLLGTRRTRRGAALAG